MFANFTVPEIRSVLDGLGLARDARVLDVGCGIGATAGLIAGLLGDAARVVGADLSLPHLRLASEIGSVAFVQADAGNLCFQDATFDFIWSCNTINHLRDPVGALQAMRATLKGDGRIVLAQSGLLPEMFFAWDAPLDEAVRGACHEYYRKRYGLTVQDTAGVRGLIGLVRQAGLTVGRVQTITIERVQPLSAVDREYFEEAIFAGTWGERIHPFLTPDERTRLVRNCTPEAPGYCLDRPDFHHLQTLTLCECHA